jgi:diguanylate cyclase (GGDEF)-like protein
LPLDACWRVARLAGPDPGASGNATMTIIGACQALLAAAALLALGFHRNRALQVFALLLVAAMAWADGGARVVEGALRFIPLLLLACTLMPEPRLLSRRHLALLLVGGILAGVVLAAPEHVHRGLLDGAAWLAAGLSAPRAGSLLAGIAAGLCLLRWTFTGRPMEFGLVGVLALAAAAFGFGGDRQSFMLLAGAAAIGILSVLYASYRMAFIDPLSNLPNRRALDETLMRLSGGYALAMADIDHFKQFNDTYGHDAGDLVLRAVGHALRRHGGGTAYRYGGEEFCLVFEGARAKQAALRCEQAREAVQALRIMVPAAAPKRGKIAAIKRPEVQVSVTVSIGLAMRGEGRRQVGEVLKAADQALYRAKGKGRNRVVEA